MYPSLYQLNTRVLMTDLSRGLGRAATLDDIPEGELDRLGGLGFDWVWLLSVWTTGEAGRKVSRENRQWRREFEETLPDLCEADIAGSGFAIAAYEVPPDLGGDAALARLRQRLAKRGLKLMLDFVPNHLGLDHPWVNAHPDFLVPGTEALLAHEPQNYIRLGNRVFAYGRDPFFPGWPDTLQLDYSNPATREAMSGELMKIAGQCDGVRCDMAMLILPEVFERTWGRKAQPFWPQAILRVREKVPDFCFMAEVYWDMEWALQQQGFDYTYDKRLYDRLCEGQARPVREHLQAGLDYQARSARFLENHDEPRAAAVFEPPVHRAAAVIAYSVPGLRFFHQGQFEGRKKRISPHLVRAPEESTDEEMLAFYGRLMESLRNPVMKNGEWERLVCRAAWDGNGSWAAFIVHCWRDAGGARLLITVNYASHSSQCYVRLPFPELQGRSVQLKDQLSAARYTRDGSELNARGLYLDLPAWGYHIFAVKPHSIGASRQSAVRERKIEESPVLKCVIDGT